MRIKLTFLLLCALLLFSHHPNPVHANSTLQIGFDVAQADAAHIAAAQMAGGRFVVQLFDWATIEPTPGYHYWATSDAALRAAEFYGLGMVARLDHPPAWALDENSPAPWSLEAYAAFVRRVVERYGNRLDGIILWNEPNLRLEWNDEAPDPAAYVALLQAGATAARAVNPTVPLFLAGLAFTEGGDGNLNDLDFLRGVYAAGGAPYFDGLALHPYGFGAPPEAAPASSTLNFRRLELHRQIILANGDADKPLWITEMGWRVRAPDPADQWQVVTPMQQADFTSRAIKWVEEKYPWIERMAFWQLAAAGDDYGFDLWQGTQAVSPAYQALVDACQATSDCANAPAKNGTASVPIAPGQPLPIEIVAPDVIIRLGDRDMLHPHWVHLYNGNSNGQRPDEIDNNKRYTGSATELPLPSLRWRGEFFLPVDAINQRYTLLLETMQIDQPLNTITINGQSIGELMPRSRPDPTSTWVTQQITVPTRLLQSGVNTIAISAGERNPAWQYADWRWENMQVRNIRLRPSLYPINAVASSRFTDWQQMATPGGWAEAVRLREGTGQSIWLNGNRLGQLWQGTAQPDQTWQLVNQAGNLSDRRFFDLLAQGKETLAATDHGLFYRLNTRQGWQPVATSPANAAYVLLAHKGYLYAGFANAGIWRSRRVAGPWQAVGLPNETVRDLVVDGTGTLYAATNEAIYAQSSIMVAVPWRQLPTLPTAAETAFVTRLFGSSASGVVARAHDQLWRWDGAAWSRYGVESQMDTPEQTALLDCCRADTLLQQRGMGLLHQRGVDQWSPQLGNGDGVREDPLARLEVMDLLRVAKSLFAATATGLWSSTDEGGSWQLVHGLPATVSDLLIDPQNANRWLAATPVGLYRSEDAGALWSLISPPWDIYDMAWGADGRLYVARARGVAWSADISAQSVSWQETAGYDRVLFFKVAPQPDHPAILWAGTWGNAIGSSTDGGQSMSGMGNGLETLSMLDILWHATPGQVTIATIEGLYRSDDGGSSWFRLPGPLSTQTIYSLYQSADGTLWAGAADGLWWSSDYGVTWQQIRPLAAITVVRMDSVTDAAGNLILWAGSERNGWWLSEDNGQQWQWGGLADRTVFAVATTKRAEGTQFIVATDDGIFSTAW